MAPYVSKLPPARIERLQRWHDEVSAELHDRGSHDVTYLGLELHVPALVFPPTPTSDLLGRQVRDRVRPGDRVLDLGCGAGANAILAAQVTEHVVAVDVNPVAVAATADNAARNGVAERVRCHVSDVFSEVDDAFDLVVIDPPFRWFPAVDDLDRAVTDEGYATLARFVTEVADHLRPDGSVLLFFGTSGDVDHLEALLAEARLTGPTVAERHGRARGEAVTYFVRHLTHDRPARIP